MSKVAHIGAVWCAVATLAGAQPPEREQTPSERGRVQFAVRVESVTLDVVVVDERGRFVPGLVESDFEILDGGEPQEIQFFTAEFTPVTTMLLLDSSASIRSNLGAIQTAGYLFAQNLSEGDTARIGLFSSGVRFGPRFTDEMAEHYALLRSMRPAGKTALYDAIIAALEELGVVEGRKSLLVFTDGDDSGPAQQGSEATMSDAIEAAKQSEVTIYTVGFTGWGPDGSDSVNRPFLTTLAEATGGRAYFPEDVEAVKTAFLDVQEDLHRHYRMAYIPPEKPEPEPGTEPDETWRPLQVRIKNRDDLLVRTRQGYYAGVGESP
jgi:VWFA-related protein